MDALSKRQKKLSAETVIKHQDYCVDRISNLPPDLNGNILSLLPTKQAVATSVLSSTWKWFWTFITRLGFVHSYKHLLEPSLVSFVYRALVFRKPAALDFFGVSCFEKENITHLRAWVSTSLLVDVKELHLFILLKDATHVLPFELFSSKKLVKLILMTSFQLDVPSTVCLPSLQVLTLHLVEIPDEDSLKRLIMGCPALEELKVTGTYFTPPVLPQQLFSCINLTQLQLSNCSFMNVPSLVSLPSFQALDFYDVKFPDDNSAKRLLCGCPSLQSLNIRKEYFKILHIAAPSLSNLKVPSWGEECKLVLETPSLRYLIIDGVPADNCELTDINQLVEAHIKVRAMPLSKGYKGASNLIMSLSNVKFLYLGSSIMKDLVESGCDLPKFHNLTTLKLEVSNNVGWALLPDLLEKSAFLETLVFEHGLKQVRRRVQDAPVNATWHKPEKVPYCLIHHLKVIQINYFSGDIEDEEILQYFIENRGALKDLTIQYSSGRGEIWDIYVEKM